MFKYFKLNFKQMIDNWNCNNKINLQIREHKKISMKNVQKINMYIRVN